MRIGLYPGSFDPITLGHLDIIERGAKMFDKLYVGIASNIRKTNLFTDEERLEMVKNECKRFSNVEVILCNGLTVNEARRIGAEAILRGLRATMDFEYELQMANANKVIDEEVETLFMMTNQGYSYLSSSMVKEIALAHGDISNFVTPNVEEKLKEKFNIK